MKSGELVPLLIPFTFHWYTGEMPPFTEVAVKETGIPLQTGFPELTMDTADGKIGLTSETTGIEMAGFPVAQ
jgi:hypothetical protein